MLRLSRDLLIFHTFTRIYFITIDNKEEAQKVNESWEFDFKNEKTTDRGMVMNMMRS